MCVMIALAPVPETGHLAHFMRQTTLPPISYGERPNGVYGSYWYRPGSALVSSIAAIRARPVSYMVQSHYWDFFERLGLAEFKY